VTVAPENAIFLSVTVYSKNVFNQCNLSAQVEEVQCMLVFVM